MKPTSKQFSLAMDLMNISSDNTLYIYANKGCGFVHRAYWTFRSGHDPNKVKLVQGSLDEWEDNGGRLEYTELKDSDDRMLQMPTDWESQTPKYKCYKTNNTIDMNVVMDIVNKKSNAIIVDARSHGRFIGKDPEPRPGLRGGHMPNALNVPFASLLREDDMTKFKSMDRVKQIFIEAGIKPYEECTDNEKKVVCSCGSGVTAATLAIGLEECGLRKREDIYIYDGSWIEWGGDTTTPIIKDVSV
jgi:thiosulfate/3-mercaptopyruvate sulfurtransferase